MEPQVDGVQPTRRLGGFGHDRRIRGDLSDVLGIEVRRHLGRKPAWMPRLDHEGTRISRAECLEETPDGWRVIREAWWQLHEETAELRAEAPHLGQKCIEYRVRVDESLLVGERLGDFGSKPKIVRNARGPSRVRGRPMRVVEARVDLDGRKPRGVSLEVRSAIRKLGPLGFGDGPSSAC